MYIVKKYVVQYNEKVLFSCFNIDTGKEEILKPDNLKGLIESNEVANAKISKNGVITINGYKKTQNISIESVKSKLVTVNYSYNNNNASESTKELENNANVLFKDRVKEIVRYCNNVKDAIKSNRDKPLSKYDIAKLINPDSKINDLVNNGSYNIADDEALIPVDIYCALYSEEDNSIPVWTNLICFSTKYHNFIKISQILDMSRLSDNMGEHTEKQCDSGESWVNDTTVAINDLVYYDVYWVNIHGDRYTKAREILGDEAIDTINSTLNWDNIRDKVGNIRDTWR